ncbi:alpha/beta hydrolase [Treponema phagedenis]|uniref:Hydrolase, alpha/beta domain protein n=1 Tax=Treponema phagedenis TaxID=162 RepID=A0A0B7GUP8_TREPH|nr:alpha/beta hydrolase [Treponema phagedenis]EFW37578.1 hydrolase, alpha/beta domain protein [Treponema phagedenis F0421]NVP24859.1 alpha/beta hydrolase [Treponema phagedenis]QEJ96004.1 lysophospholipase [Treponema phagedenis]QEJ98965.1 lysophospholipase [Treponema phagedenis]QEK01767.1 lysophospholipase [Treponema phagedenis]
MQKATSIITQSDGEKVFLYEWIPDGNFRGVIQLVHGMAEHAGRYAEFAGAAVKNGYAVFAADHRGHGKTAGSKENLGYLADSDGFNRVLEDQREINAMIQQRYPQKPVYLIGHSFGSFISQGYIEKYADTVKACILIGTSGPNPAAGVGKLLADSICAIRGRKKVSSLLQALSFGSFNKGIKNPQTPTDWLSRDANEVAKYNGDPYCGFACTAGFYQDLLGGLRQIHRKEAMAAIPKEFPVLLLAGAADPVGNYGKSVKMLEAIYKGNGMKNVSCVLYEGARHEILNETNKTEAMKDIFQWLNKT